MCLVISLTFSLMAWIASNARNPTVTSHNNFLSSPFHYVSNLSPFHSASISAAGAQVTSSATPSNVIHIDTLIECGYPHPLKLTAGSNGSGTHASDLPKEPFSYLLRVLRRRSQLRCAHERPKKGYYGLIPMTINPFSLHFFFMPSPKE